LEVRWLRVLVIGAEKLGAQVIKQLKKMPEVAVVVAERRERPVAVESGVVDKVDIVAHVTTLNFEEVLGIAHPDFVILARTVEDWDKAETPMGSEYVVGMERELTKFDVAVLPVDSRVLGPY
jgi:dTDP-4-dehydrorhamnose reductase